MIKKKSGYATVEAEFISVLTSFVRAAVIWIEPLFFDVSNTFTRYFAFREACRNKPLAQGAKICLTAVVSTVADDALSAR
jgi:hypothetical protein